MQNKETQKALQIYQELVTLGDNEAIFELGKLYFKGEGVSQNFEKAMQYFQIASNYGETKATYNTAIIYANKNYQNHSYQKAFDIFLKLANQNHPKAQNQVGFYLLHGIAGEKDYKEAVSWFEKSYFENDYKPASCNLAVMFANGYGVFPNFGRARKLAQEGFEKKIPTCVKVYEEFQLKKYPEDKGFKTGYYKNF